MLGKLIKHEFKETYKLFGILYGAFILLTLISRFSLKLPFDNIISELIGGLLTLIYIVSLFGLTLAVTIIVMIRFYNKMMKDEAYLTHTIPVKTWEHIVAKITTYSVWISLSVVMMIVSAALYFVGTKEFDKIMGGFEKILEFIGDYPVIYGSIVFALVICILQAFTNLFMYSAALSLGQMFRKHKIAGAVLFYFVLSYGLGGISSALMYIMPGYVEKMEKFEVNLANIESKKEAVSMLCGTANYIMVCALLVALLSIGVCFFITNYMLSKKLELE